MSFAFVGAGALSWLVVGLLLDLSDPLRDSLVVSGVAYGVAYGTAANFGIRLRTIGFRWQVPARWLRGRHIWQRWLIWGTMLGPGFPTRNPYAGFWLVLPLAAPGGTYALAAAGAAHGLGRAAGILSNVVHACPMADPATWSARQHWILIDRALLVFGAGLLAGYAALG
jgi:hypothetical protein